MPEWNLGYITDINYTAGYYDFLNPLRARLAFACMGLAFPEVRTACELGFGEGVSIAMHAAASEVAWHGTDFNASQASFARHLAGGVADLRDASFAEFLEATDLPDFDFIGLHGIWSWINHETQEQIVAFLRRKLRVGGVFYISYNVYPGWAAFAPLRHLAKLHYDTMGAPADGVEARVKAAFAFLERLKDARFMAQNPQAEPRLARAAALDSHYLAHEYFNRDWEPVYFAEMREILSGAKLDYACSATFHELVTGLTLTPEQRTFLDSLPDPMFRQSVFDFLINQQFRRDYWVRGARRMGRVEQADTLRGLPVVLQNARPALPLKVACARGEAELKGERYAGLLDCLADNRPHTIGELAQRLPEQSFNAVCQAVLILSGSGYLTPANPAETTKAVAGACAALNRRVMESARDNAGITCLASPVTGGGVPASRFEQLFIEAMADGERSASDMAGHVWRLLEARGERLIRDGQPMAGLDENMAELTQKAANFLTDRLPSLQALGVC